MVKNRKKRSKKANIHKQSQSQSQSFTKEKCIETFNKFIQDIPDEKFNQTAKKYEKYLKKSKLLRGGSGNNQEDFIDGVVMLTGLLLALLFYKANADHLPPFVEFMWIIFRDL